MLSFPHPGRNGSKPDDAFILSTKRLRTTRLPNLLEAPPPGRKLFLTLLTAKKAAAMKDILVRSSPSRAHGGW
jgi:hypothetical protein